MKSETVETRASNLKRAGVEGKGWWGSDKVAGSKEKRCGGVWLKMPVNGARHTDEMERTRGQQEGMKQN